MCTRLTRTRAIRCTADVSAPTRTTTDSLCSPEPTGLCVCVSFPYVRVLCSGDVVGYHCLRIERRSSQIAEFQMGTAVSQHPPDSSWCDNDSSYSRSAWTVVAGEHNTPVTVITHTPVASTDHQPTGSDVVRTRRSLQHTQSTRACGCRLLQLHCGLQEQLLHQTGHIQVRQWCHCGL